MGKKICEFFFKVVDSLEFIFSNFYVIGGRFCGVLVNYKEFDVVDVFRDYVIVNERFCYGFVVFVDFIDVLGDLFYFVERLMLLLGLGGFVDIGSVELVLVYEDLFLLDELFFDKV